MKDCIVTISRGYGSGGKQIGMMLAKDMDVPYYDHDLFMLASEESGISEKLFAKSDERINSRFKGLLSKKDYELTVASPDSKKFTSEDNLFNYQAYIIREIAKKGPCVFIGRAADFVLKDFADVVSVNIEAPFEDCTKTIMEMFSLSRPEAERRIKKINKERDDYYKYHTGNERSNSLNYNLTINSSKTGWENSVALIKAYCQLYIK